LIFTDNKASVNNQKKKTVLKSGKGTAAASKRKNTKQPAATNEGMSVMYCNKAKTRIRRQVYLYYGC